MRLKVVLASLFCAFALAFGSEAKAQVVTATPDSVLITKPDTLLVTPDTTVVISDTPEAEAKERKRFLKDWSPPAKAAFYSAVLPGLGQAYNKSYWKIPLIYATGAVIGYFIYDNHKKYRGFATALDLRTDGNPETVDEYVNHPSYGIGLYNNHGTTNLRRGRDFFRKYRDLDIILAFVAYGLNIMEAHVHAHLKGFDVSDDLSVELKPGIIQVAAQNSYTPALTLQFNLKR